jgi:hypothetical protein
VSKSSVQRRPLPDHALLTKFARDGAYADCYVVTVPRNVSHAEYVEAFYTSWLFKLERFILTWFVEKPSTDEEARTLSRGERETFAAWSVESRAGNQLVMLDFMSYTCSWLMIETRPAETALYFGTGVMRRTLGFRLLMPFHRLYARSLLAAAGARLRHTAAY